MSDIYNVYKRIITLNNNYDKIILNLFNYLSLSFYFGILYLYCSIQQLLDSVYRTTLPAINLWSLNPIAENSNTPISQSFFLYLTTFPTPKVFANLQKPKQKTDPSNQIKQKMNGRREMHRNTSQSVRKARIGIAIAIGVTLGCVFAIFLPHGLFTSSTPILARTISKSNAQVPTLQPHFFFFINNKCLFIFV